MAEETIDQLVIPEKTEFDEKANGNGAGDSATLHHEDSANTYHTRASITSNSTSNSSRRNSPKITQKTVPHYLRASTGSCHDLCKYGRKHAFEEKTKRPLMKRLQKSLPSKLDSAQILISGEKKEKLVKQKSSMDTNNRSPDSKASVIKSCSPDRKLSLDKKKNLPTAKLEKAEVVKQKSSKGTIKHSPGLNLSTESNSRFPKFRTRLDAEKYRPMQNGSSCNKSRSPNYKPLLTEKTPSPDHSEIIKREIRSPSKMEIRAKKNSFTGDKTSKTGKWKYSSSSLKSKPLKVNASSSVNSEATRVKGERNRDVSSTRKMISSGKKDLALSTANLSPNLSFSNATAIKARKAVNPLKNRNKIKKPGTKTTENEKVPEKTLHVIKTETEKSALELESKSNDNDNVIPSLPSSPSHASSSNGNSSYFSHEQDDLETEHSANDTDECSSDKKESMEICEKQSLEENQNKTLKKNKVVASEVKYCSPVKLKFRIGKLVDLHADNNTPRRLKFRRARILGGDQVKGDLTRRTFKKAGSDNDANNAERSSEKVSLKHQNVQGKKDERGLFNNVIEETASKLVESRKSKVKALVGAFETVISLQESKPSSHAVI